MENKGEVFLRRVMREGATRPSEYVIYINGVATHTYYYPWVRLALAKMDELAIEGYTQVIDPQEQAR